MNTACLRKYACLAIVFAICLAAPAAETGDLHAVIFNARFEGASPYYSLWEEYRIVEHHYWSARGVAAERQAQNKDRYRFLDAAFVDDLKKAKFLYIGQYTGDSAAELLNDPVYREALKTFLREGGTVFFDYSFSPAAAAFLKSVGVEPPGALAGTRKPEYYTAHAWTNDMGRAVFLTGPIPIMEGLAAQAYGCFGQWSLRQYAPLRKADELERAAAMVVQDGVQGRGRVVFNQCYDVFRNKGSALAANILSWIYGVDIRQYRDRKDRELGGPGALVDLQ